MRKRWWPGVTIGGGMLLAAFPSCLKAGLFKGAGLGTIAGALFFLPFFTAFMPVLAAATFHRAG